MINETASSADHRSGTRAPVVFEPSSDGGLRDELRQIVTGVLAIEREPSGDPDFIIQRDSILLFNRDSRLTATFEGHLLIDSEEAYRQLDEAFTPLDHTPYFRTAGNLHVIHAVQGRVRPRERRVWINIALFVLTFISVLFVGTRIAAGEVDSINSALSDEIVANPLAHLWRGLPYALSIMLILGSHELGHYFAARRHKIAVTLPYFLPTFPILELLNAIDIIGTFGAFIQIQAPFRNRKTMFDIGAAGPLTGLVFAIPILLIGLATSPVQTIPPLSIAEGNSLLYALAKTVVFGRFLPDNGVDVFINQLASAGWAGLFMTGLNLLPAGQLDGGHVLYALVGKHAQRLYFPILALAAILIFISPVWLFWGVLIFFFGRFYAAPLDMITPLDSRRRALATFTLALFIFTIVPVPLSIVQGSTAPVPQTNVMLMLGSVFAVMAFQRLRR